MIIEELLLLEEGKTLEYKEQADSLASIIKTVIAFANTAGGTLVLGIENRTKRIVGIDNVFNQEERLINAISDSIVPLLVPHLEIQSFRGKHLILIKVPHAAGPFYLKSAGPEQGTFIRSGSTSRVADEEMLDSLKLFARRTSFDEIPYLGETELLDLEAIQLSVSRPGKQITLQACEALGLLTTSQGKLYPSNGGIILFGRNRERAFPDALIRCVRFVGVTKNEAIDHTSIRSYPTQAVEDALHFIQKNSFMSASFEQLKRIDLPQFPPIAVREALLNALVHSDYSIKGASILIAVYDDRLEITNPGALPFGMTLEDALNGSSRVRNRVIARLFHELELIEQWGSGIRKIIDSCEQRGLKRPFFEELSQGFRVTLYATQEKPASLDAQQKAFLKLLEKKGSISPKEAAAFLNLAPPNARNKLKVLIDLGLIAKRGSSSKDPQSVYVLTKTYR